MPILQLEKLSSPKEIITEQGCRSPECKPLSQLRPEAPFCRVLCNVGTGGMIQGSSVLHPCTFLCLPPFSDGRRAVKRMSAAAALEMSRTHHYLISFKPPPQGPGTCQCVKHLPLFTVGLSLFLMTTLMTLICRYECG